MIRRVLLTIALLLDIIVGGCAVPPSAPVAVQPTTQASASPGHLIVLISGVADQTKLLWMKSVLAEESPDAEIIGLIWNDKTTLDTLASDHREVVIVGHSFGGDEAAKLAGRMTNAKVHLVLIDPVNEAFWWSMARPKFKLPANVIDAHCYVRGTYTAIPPFSSELEPQPNVTNILLPTADHANAPAQCYKDISHWASEIFYKAK